MALQWQEQNLNQTSNSQQPPHTSPSWASYGVSIVRILEKIDRVLMALHCIRHIFWNSDLFWLKICLWDDPSCRKWNIMILTSWSFIDIGSLQVVRIHPSKKQNKKTYLFMRAIFMPTDGLYCVVFSRHQQEQYWFGKINSLYPPLQRIWKGGILVSPCPSVRLWTESYSLCIFNNSRRIHFIYAHLIKQLQKVCCV